MVASWVAKAHWWARRVALSAASASAATSRRRCCRSQAGLRPVISTAPPPPFGWVASQDMVFGGRSGQPVECVSVDLSEGSGRGGGAEELLVAFGCGLGAVAD